MSDETLPDVLNDAVKHEREEQEIEPGQWYWINQKIGDTCIGSPFPTEFKWFVCVVHIGSNYVLFNSPHKKHSYSSDRMHFKDMEKNAILEKDPDKIIKQNLFHHQKIADKYLNQIKDITKRLGVFSQNSIGDNTNQETALAVQNSNRDAIDYKNALIKANNETLPNLFKKVKIQNEQVVKWLSANSMKLESAIKSMEKVIHTVDKRIFNVTLYTGLSESVVHILNGQEPGEYHEKIHLMQNRLHMDEECLINYKAGGMEFENIDSFDSWLIDSENFERYFPFPKCIVSFKIRRNEKVRYAEDIQTIRFNHELSQYDKITFLYIRNGDNLYRINSDLEFGEKLFPNKSDFDPQEPLMIREVFTETMPVREWEIRVKEEKERIIKEKKWHKDNPKEQWEKNNPNGWYENSNPYYSGYRINILDKEWKPFNKNTVYYDDVMQKITDEIEQYNRIALIVQGLLDRSEILHPHPTISISDKNSFLNMIKLIYDGSAALYETGEEPDFEEYRKKCNDSADRNSMFIGQDQIWELREGQRESDRRRNSRYDYNRPPVEKYRPYDDPGPGYMTKAALFHPRSRKVTFKWLRDRRTYSYYREEPVKVSITIPLEKLFNVDAYKPGDFKKFFRDPRTRAKYLQWAPMLIAAEEYHCKKTGGRPLHENTINKN